MAFRNEAFSFFSHLIGALAGVVALVLMVQRAHGALATAAYAVYGVTLVLMFTSSTFHHVAHREGGLARRFDMTAIYLFIAGTFTPVCVLALPTQGGWWIFALLWLIAVVGIALLWTRPATPRRVTAGLYLGMGWLSMLGAVPFTRTLGYAALAFLVAGGVVYTVGAIVYARKRPDPWPHAVGHHGLWHVFVLVAVSLHFLMIWRYVPTA